MSDSTDSSTSFLFADLTSPGLPGGSSVTYNSSLTGFSIEDDSISSGVVRTSATISYDGSNRMLAECLLNPFRPELLCLLDINPVVEKNTDGTYDSSYFYDYLDSKLSIRGTDLNTVNSVISSLSESYPEEFKQALEQYESSVASSRSEISLIKLAYQLKQYAVLGPNFRDFLELHWPPYSEIGVSSGTVKTWTDDIYGITLSTDSLPSSSLLLGQLVQRVAWCTVIGSWRSTFRNASLSEVDLSSTDSHTTDYSILTDATSDEYYPIAMSGLNSGAASLGQTTDANYLSANSVEDIWYPGGSSTPEDNRDRLRPHLHIFSNILSNDLCPSYVVKQCINSGGGFDPVLWDILNRRVGTSWLEGLEAQEKQIFYYLSGWDPFIQARKKAGDLEKDLTSVKQFVPDLALVDLGLIGDSFGEEISYVDKHNIEYTRDNEDTATLQSIKEVVEKAFSSDALDFSEYEELVEALESSARDFGVGLGRLHRVGKYKKLNVIEKNKTVNSSGVRGKFGAETQGAFDSSIILRSAIEVFKERFADNFIPFFLKHAYATEAGSPYNAGKLDAGSMSDWTTDSSTSPSDILKWSALLAYPIINGSKDAHNSNGAHAAGLGLGKSILKAFVGDFYDGQMTFNEETVEVMNFYTDSDGVLQETTSLEPANADPFTGETVNISSKYSRVWSALGGASGDVEQVMKKASSLWCDTGKFTNAWYNYWADEIDPGHGTDEGTGAEWETEQRVQSNNNRFPGWLECAPFYIAKGMSHYKYPSLLTYMVMDPTAWIDRESADLVSHGDASIFDDDTNYNTIGGYVRDAQKDLIKALRKGYDGSDSEVEWDLTDSSGDPEGTVFEPSPMWKYSWHWLDDFWDEYDDSQIPFLANLWGAEIIEMCMKTMQLILEFRGIKIGSASAGETVFPYAASMAPYKDNKDYVSILRRTADLDALNEFPGDQCFWNAASMQDDGYETGINFKKWVPTMRAVHENFCREDGTLIASGKPLESMFGHILDIMASLMRVCYPNIQMAGLKEPYYGGDTCNGRTRRWPTGTKPSKKYDEFPNGPPVWPKVIFPYFNKEVQSGYSSISERIWDVHRQFCETAYGDQCDGVSFDEIISRHWWSQGKNSSHNYFDAEETLERSMGD